MFSMTRPISTLRSTNHRSSYFDRSRPAFRWRSAAETFGAFARRAAAAPASSASWPGARAAGRGAAFLVVATAFCVGLLFGASQSRADLCEDRSIYYGQGFDGMPEVSEIGDLMAWAVAAGDFDDDGYQDLLLGTPGEEHPGGDQAGQVVVLYGGPGGFDLPASQVWSQDTAWVASVAEADDLFGASLAVGDFDGDGYDDAAIGAPGETFDLGGGDLRERAGAVHVFYGGPAGLQVGGADFWWQGHAGFVGSSASDDEYFGTALAAADFDGDGYDDLAISAPNEDNYGFEGLIPNAGTIRILFGSAGGLGTAGSTAWGSAWAWPISIGGRFGAALAAGDFDADGHVDLAVGAPGLHLDGKDEAGGVAVLPGSANGPTLAGVQIFSEGVDGLPGAAGVGDEMGYALAAGDFDGDGIDDLAFGVPGERMKSGWLGLPDVGRVRVLYGSAGPGLTTAAHTSIALNTIKEAINIGQRFGSSLAAGDLDGDGIDDLAAGAPGDDDGAIDEAGAVWIFSGNAGQTFSLQRRVRQEGGTTGFAEDGDHFGHALAIADLDADGEQDLAVGTPYEGFGAEDAGTVNLFFGCPPFVLGPQHFAPN